MGHVSWLIAYLIKRVLQEGPATLLLGGSMKSSWATTTIKRVMACVKRVRDDRKQRLELNSRRRSIRT